MSGVLFPTTDGSPSLPPQSTQTRSWEGASRATAAQLGAAPLVCRVSMRATDGSACTVQLELPHIPAPQEPCPRLQRLRADQRRRHRVRLLPFSAPPSPLLPVKVSCPELLRCLRRAPPRIPLPLRHTSGRCNRWPNSAAASCAMPPLAACAHRARTTLRGCDPSTAHLLL